MDIVKITEIGLLDNPAVRSVDFEHENYFSINDLNQLSMGAFNNMPYILLPLRYPNGRRELTACIGWTDIQSRINELADKSEFQQRINTALNFNPRKK